MNYPTLEQVEKANHYNLCEWYRFLSSPITDSQVQIMNRICERCKAGGGFTPVISKELGWEQR